MKTYLVSYDLRVPETSEDYKRLIEYIKSHYSWAKPLYSVWLICTEKSVSTVRDEIMAKTDANDRTLVIDVTGANWASNGIKSDVTDWMKKNI